LGGAVGVAILSTVISAVGVVRVVGGRPHPYAHAYHLAFLAAAALSVLAAGLALGVNDRDAAPSMRRTTSPSAEPEAALTGA
jgi:hypothetical protein